ncbi:hypothetical protein [Gimesia maris]|uniref:hypothetical protein n=1 Tax=Gimesia maris TaxID=122 RepID=UPI0032ED3D1A
MNEPNEIDMIMPQDVVEFFCSMACKKLVYVSASQPDKHGNCETSLFFSDAPEKGWLKKATKAGVRKGWQEQFGRMVSTDHLTN